MHLGIDFGTTFSSAALFVNGEIKRVKEPMRSGYSYPSSAFVNKEGKVFVGQAAENQRGQDPSSYRREFKRDLGQKTPSSLGNRKFLPEDLVSEMLKVLKREAEEMVNRQRIESAIVTIPASYAGYRTELMEQAAQDAGFKQVQLLPEPVAAAIYYDRGQPLVDGERLLVYDLGGGTFDAALMQKRGDRFELLAQPVGDEKLGGRDFDTAIYQHLRQNCSETLNQLLDPRQRDARAMRIRYRVEDWLRDFKHQLSVVETHTDDLPIGDFDYTMSRSTFQGLIHQQLQTTGDLCNQLVRDAGLKWNQVGRILLVGGSCRIPYVRQLLEERFNCNVVRVDEPELAVCLGAAIYQEVITQINVNREATNFFDQGYLKHYQLNDFQGALVDYNQAILLNPQYASAYKNRGLLKSYKLNDFQGALADYNQAILLNPQDAELYNHRGLNNYQLNEFQTILLDLNQAISLSPQNAKFYNNRGALKDNLLNDINGALADYNQAIALDPQEADFYYHRGILKVNSINDISGALDDFNQAIALNPQEANFYYSRCKLKQDNINDINGALNDYNQAIALNPHKASYYYERGLLKNHKVKDTNGALNDYSQAIALDPQNASYYYCRAAVRMCDTNDINGALNDYNQAIALNPQEADFYYGRSFLKANALNDLRGGLSDIEIALNLKPQDKRYRDSFNSIKNRL